MTPEEKPSSAEAWARARRPDCKYPKGSGSALVQNDIDCFLAGAQWQAAQVAEAVGKLERVRDMLDASFSFDKYVREIDSAIALLKGGTK